MNTTTATDCADRLIELGQTKLKATPKDWEEMLSHAREGIVARGFTPEEGNGFINGIASGMVMAVEAGGGAIRDAHKKDPQDSPLGELGKQIGVERARDLANFVAMEIALPLAIIFKAAEQLGYHVEES